MSEEDDRCERSKIVRVLQARVLSSENTFVACSSVQGMRLCVTVFGTLETLESSSVMHQCPQAEQLLAFYCPFRLKQSRHVCHFRIIRASIKLKVQKLPRHSFR